jgi:hypothetical protein
MFAAQERRRVPVVLFAEGGGGRPGDVDWPIIAGLDCRAFHPFAKLSGLVPLIGIASGYCFAGNAALLGCCDVVIATEDASIGIGGPAMIEGGGLGVYDPQDVGPIDVQYANGVVDLRVPDERAAVKAAKQYLSYFGAPPDPGASNDPDALRDLIPTNRKRVYDIRTVIDALLVFALLVAPPAAAQQLTMRPGPGLVLSVVFALFVVWLGLGVAYFSIYPVGFYVTSFAFALYLLARLARAARARRRHGAAPNDDD